MSPQSNQGRNREAADPAGSRAQQRRVAVLAWGSLKWRLGVLRVRGEWHEDGPILPLEFSKRSSKGRLTLVIDEVNGVPCRSGWWESGLERISDAIANLADREGMGRIGFVDAINGESKGRDPEVVATIEAWLSTTSMSAVIWTDLSADFQKKTGRPFSVDNAIAYLRGLGGEERDAAFEYLERAPASVQTPLRRRAIAAGLIAVGPE